AGLYQKVASNDKPEELLLPGEKLFPEDWTSKGILYNNGSPSPDLWFLPLAADRKPYDLGEDSLSQVAAQFSPNERWFAYSSNELGRPEIFVNSFPPSAKRRVSPMGGALPGGRRGRRE